MDNDINLRWSLKSFNVSKSTFYVIDKLANKLRVFHVPYLEQVELRGGSAYAFTSNSKVMQLDLLCNGRQFLNTTELETLKLNKRPTKTPQNKTVEL